MVQQFVSIEVSEAVLQQERCTLFCDRTRTVD
ncbi:MAG: hypothetical protein KatS3mg042_0167 [Rhodothermaceae bacterium]|nr:MAG: hypothetical protein KatS3mg042_0167 [Rhodothermaceae bacterium]